MNSQPSCLAEKRTGVILSAAKNPEGDSCMDTSGILWILHFDRSPWRATSFRMTHIYAQFTGMPGEKKHSVLV